MQGRICLVQPGMPLPSSKPQIFPQPLQPILTLTTLPFYTILCYECPSLKLPTLLHTFQLLTGIKQLIFTVRKLTGCSCLMAGIWALREFPYNVTTGHMTLWEYPFLARGPGWFPQSILSIFEDDGPYNTLHKY